MNENEQKKTLPFKFGNDIIERNNYDKGERLLGIFISASNTENTQKEIINTTLAENLNLISKTRIPDSIAITTINTVTLPRLAYMCQNIPVPKNEIRAIDSKIRQLIKRNLKLPKNFPVEQLYVKGLYNLSKLEDILEQDTIQKTENRLNDSSLVGEMARARERIITEKLGLITPIYTSNKYIVHGKYKASDSLELKIISILQAKTITFKSPVPPKQNRITPLDQIIEDYETYRKISKNTLNS